jgi:hypothetical protein
MRTRISRTLTLILIASPAPALADVTVDVGLGAGYIQLGPDLKVGTGGFSLMPVGSIGWYGDKLDVRYQNALPIFGFQLDQWSGSG